MEHWLARLWDDLVGRIGGPMSFRLVLQPAMALYLAVRAGLKDARQGRSPYMWALLHRPQRRSTLLHETWRAVAHVFILAVVMDAIYQFIVLRWFYPVEALLASFILAVVPYALMRGPVNWLAQRWSGRSGSPPRPMRRVA